MSTRFDDIFTSGVISGTISGLRKEPVSEAQKVRIRPFESKGETLYQFTYTVREKEIHENFSSLDAAKKVDELLGDSFTQALLCTNEVDWHAVSLGKLKIRKKPPTKQGTGVASHNKKKTALLDETADFLVRLGVSSDKGVLKGKNDKYRQINKYLELIESVIPTVKDRPLHIVDFGCGKAYLTFAVYHYLTSVLGISCNITGLDLKEDVIDFCNAVAVDLGYDNLKFSVGDISAWSSDQPIDMVITLHACDTATDYAIAKAIKWGAKTIITVPCCQHELFSQINSEVQRPLLRHGIIKERVSALVTDAARAQLLEAVGYKADVIEFIDMEHTPKNIMIRATKTGKKNSQALKEYTAFAKEWNINPCLHGLLDL